MSELLQRCASYGIDATELGHTAARILKKMEYIEVFVMFVHNHMKYICRKVAGHICAAIGCEKGKANPNRTQKGGELSKCHHM